MGVPSQRLAIAYVVCSCATRHREHSQMRRFGPGAFDLKGVNIDLRRAGARWRIVMLASLGNQPRSA